MTNNELEDIKQLGYPLEKISRLQGGGNNRLYLIDTSPRLVAKCYHLDDKQRALHDIYFSQLLVKHDINNIAHPINCDMKRHIGIFSFIDGHKVNELTREYISQIAQFIRSINALPLRSELAEDFLAAEACFSLHEYARVIERRLDRLTHIKVETEIDEQAKYFIDNDLSMSVQELLGELTDPRQLSFEQRIISPSDFGLHNCLEIGGQLSFYDFEYAGWDDPCKMVADFFSHPAYSVDIHYLREFIDLSLDSIQADHVLNQLPITFKIIRFKWIFIILNEFLISDLKRRIYATDCHLETRKKMQFEKAKLAFSNVNMNISEYL